MFDRFGLYRFEWLYTGASLILLSATLWTAAWALKAEVQRSSEVANITLTRALVNANWDSINPMLLSAGNVELVKKNPKLPAVEGLIRNFSRGTDLVKVKIYDLAGLTLYSSDPAQIGEDKSNNAGFLQATKGRVVSELTYRGKFGGFDGDLYQRNLVSSYVPVYGPLGVEAVVEVYTDRTDSIERVERRVVDLSIFFVVLFVVVLGPLYVFTRRRTPSVESNVNEVVNFPTPASNDDPAGICSEVAWMLAGTLSQRSQDLQALETDFLSTRLDSDQAPLVRSLGILRAAEDEQARHLLWLRELLEGQRRPASTSFDLNAMLFELFHRYADSAKLRGFDVQIHMDNELPSAFTGNVELTARLLELVLNTLCGRAVSGVLQFKAQLGPRGPQLDVISSSSQKSAIGILERRLIERLAQHIGGEARLETSADSGDWFTLVLPHVKGVL